jgi:putative oxidoreductase
MKKTSVAQQTPVAQQHPALLQVGTKQNSSKKTQLQGWGIAILRVLTGYVFLAAGVHKFLYDDLGPLRNSLSMVELLFGAALIVGLLTRWVSIPLAILMLADIFVFHPPSYLFEQDPGYESALVRMVACTALAMTGSGKVALDNVVANRKKAGRLLPYGRRETGL